MKTMEEIKKLCLSRRNLSVLGVQVGIYALLVSIWSLVIMLLEHDVSAAKESMRVNAFVLFLLLTVFMANFYLLVPYLFEKRSKVKQCAFWIINLLFILLWNKHIFSIYNADLPDTTIRIGFYQFGVMWTILNYAMVVAAIFVRYYIRHNTLRRQLREQKQKMTEAELAWLKNQLNPHFLFNTLNNISSLTQTSPSNAQKAIGQLSELLRYALYETQPKEVSLNGEIAFIKNYINLMTLRSAGNVEIKSEFVIHNSQLLIAPLVFLTPVENAFKHGVSGNRPSFIHISITEDKGKIIFLCENSNYPKTDMDKSGRGIGLENMYRRLELIYPERYQIEQRISKGTYLIKITIKPCRQANPPKV